MTITAILSWWWTPIYLRLIYTNDPHFECCVLCYRVMWPLLEISCWSMRPQLSLSPMPNWITHWTWIAHRLTEMKLHWCFCVSFLKLYSTLFIIIAWKRANRTFFKKSLFVFYKKRKSYGFGMAWGYIFTHITFLIFWFFEKTTVLEISSILLYSKRRAVGSIAFSTCKYT